MLTKGVMKEIIKVGDDGMQKLNAMQGEMNIIIIWLWCCVNK